jgi:hypothetical protein
LEGLLGHGQCLAFAWAFEHASAQF